MYGNLRDWTVIEVHRVHPLPREYTALLSALYARRAKNDIALDLSSDCFSNVVMCMQDVDVGEWVHQI